MDDETKPEPGAAEAAKADSADAAARLLDEQQARIAALRTAVLSGRVPDEATFDYARFFGAPADDTPER